jgi:hypothetical protein
VRKRAYRGLRLAAIVLNAAAIVAPIYVWLGLMQVRPLSDLLHTSVVFMGVVSLAPVLALIALVAAPDRREVSL